MTKCEAKDPEMNTTLNKRESQQEGGGCLAQATGQGRGRWSTVDHQILNDKSDLTHSRLK